MIASLLVLAAATSTFDLATLDLGNIEQGWATAQRNTSVDGNPLRIAGRTFARGIGSHSVMRWSLRLGKGASKFTSWVGLDSEVGNRGSIQFEVWVDGKKAWSSPILKGGDAPVLAEVDLKGAKVLNLRVNDGGDDINYDHADWVEPQISFTGAAIAPMPIAPPKEPLPMLNRRIPSKPRFNGPHIVGCSAKRDFVWRLPVSGQRPMSFSASGLPEGLSLTKDGIVKGRVVESGVHKIEFTARNARGADQRTITIDARGVLALTPPMGWNSWNVWGTDVDAEKIHAAAEHLIESGLADFGYQFVNIDDAWEAGRDAQGRIETNEKFPDMHAVGEKVHALGLRFGIYSSPGPKTCGGYEGSYQHELQDAQRYAEWGVDYLKYDWCSYTQIHKPEGEFLKLPYRVMRDALNQSGRDIVYSMCQYGMGDVWEWGAEVGGNLWRSTGDITDTWNSLESIGFAQSDHADYAGPGHWNDPDMLVVGRLGWSKNLRPTRLTPNEQITHITLWAMIAAPLIIGCDLTALDDTTKALLMNHDVVEISQDSLGKAGRRVWQKDELEVWTRPLSDGSTAVAIFNRGDGRAELTPDLAAYKVRGTKAFDCWSGRTVTLGKAVRVPRHGALLWKVQ